MALPCIWRFCTALILLSGALSLVCERLIVHNGATRVTLRRMLQEGGLTLDCAMNTETHQIPRISPVHLTANLDVEGKAQVIRQTLDQINKTFSQNLNTAPWDPDLLAIFRLHLNTQLDELNECAREPVSDFTNQEIQQYFQELRKILERERFSACAWKLIASRTRASLQMIPAVVRTMTSK